MEASSRNNEQTFAHIDDGYNDEEAESDSRKWHTGKKHPHLKETNWRLNNVESSTTITIQQR